MPISNTFRQRLFPRLETIRSHFGTPFHIYDEAGIRATAQRLNQAFAGCDFREYFAVKALPNPRILQILAEEGFGFDCSSIPELILSRQIGARGEDILFTSNNTSRQEFDAALADGGCILNLDDISLIEKVPVMPELICFRYNPGERRAGNAIIGKPLEAKFGVTHEQLSAAYQQARQRGASRFGLHTMIVSNELDDRSLLETAQMLLERAEAILHALGIQFEFINLGGGVGIPYRPHEQPFDVESLAAGVRLALQAFESRCGYRPRLLLESGRYITGPHGVLVTSAINSKQTYRSYVGVDAAMSSLMRPGMYGAYHHIDVVGKDAAHQTAVVDVVGSLCENNDKFAIQRELPVIEDGDLLVIQDTGAHGHSMGFNYNGRLRPQELLLRADGSIERIRRAETVEDYFATLRCDPDTLR
jgi:diaminopimelate decarboxylase